MSGLKNPIYILGPTAVGKTEISVELALQIQGEIVSADSMQLYRGMDIGTAKPSIKDRKGVTHHLFDVLDIDQHCDVASFRQFALKAISEIQGRGKAPIVVGGSGMYVRSLTQGIFEGPGRDEKIRSELEHYTTEELRTKLGRVDPVSAERIGLNDRKRMLRALEYHAITGKPISAQQTEWKKDKQAPLRNDLFCLMRGRDELYRRCDARVEEMFKLGFIDEVRKLADRGLEKSPTASRAIGYPEVLRHLKGELSLEEATELIKKKTRNFVKRQISWFKTEPGLRWLEIDDKTLPGIIESIMLFVT